MSVVIFHIAVCDDELVERQYIENIVTKWARERKIEVKIDLYDSSESFLFMYQEKKDYDILLLDIEMKEMDGVTLAKKIRQDNEIMQIVFITGYSDYILEGYEVSALNYLMKPIYEEKLMMVLDKAIEKLAKNDKVLTFTTNSEMIRVPIYQINYVEVFGNYITIHANDEIKIKMTLSELEKELDERFYRVGRSIIVNLTQISRVTKKEIKLNSGILIPLPRNAYDKLNRAIIDLRW